jgi:hypothetical protein
MKYTPIPFPATPDQKDRAASELKTYNAIREAFKLPDLKPNEDKDIICFETEIPEIGSCAIEMVEREEEHETLSRAEKITRYGWRITLFYQAGGLGWEPPYTEEVIIADGEPSIARAIIIARHASELHALDDRIQCEAMAEFVADMDGEELL